MRLHQILFDQKGFRLSVLWAVALALLGSTAAFAYTNIYNDYYTPPSYGYGANSGASNQIISLDLDPQNSLNSSLRIAARERRLPDVEKFLTAKANVNSRSSDGETALMYAARNCSRNVVAVLLRAGADVNLRDAEGHTALIFATQENCLGVVADLLQVPTLDRSLKDREGHTAYDYASDNAVMDVDGPSIEIKRLLKASGLRARRLSAKLLQRSTPSPFKE